MLDSRYSAMGSLSSLMVQPAAERSAEASESSKACSHLRWDQTLDLQDATAEDVLLALLLHRQVTLLDGVVRNGVHQGRAA